MATNPFALNAVGPNASAIGSFAITPSDGADLAVAVRQITIGTAGGTLSWVGADGTTQNTGPLPVGTYPIAAHRIRATGTTATGLTGWV
jgi:hypothetical protein